MSTSTFSQINTFCLYLTETRPESFLDIGLGNGKMGFIARDLLDVMLGGRYRRKEWKVRIDGIEIFPDYIQDHQKAIYDNIFIGDAMDIIDSLDTYDMVYVGDVLEHFTKERGRQMLKKCIKHSNKYVILSIPLGEGWKQPEIYGNPHEEHKSFWNFEEFEPFVSQKDFINFPGVGPYGIFLIKREDFLYHEIRERADALFTEGKREDAIHEMIESLEGLPPDLASEYVLVDLLLKQNRFKDAVERLTAAARFFPDEQSVKEHLRQLEKKGF